MNSALYVTAETVSFLLYQAHSWFLWLVNPTFTPAVTGWLHGFQIALSCFLF